MLFKVITVFLVFMMVLAMFGKLRFPGQKRLTELKCPDCGRYKIGRGRCPCQRGGR
ncbi:hypothetical protein P73_4298 [Celeribacter indicus]|uniref:Uncharacterized protein n=1 Tax=Celeribacter indicus TaxID=1208324 RepID=A0A0B5DZX6_9RHOB|nr:hypothetical protein P73_4298 [Celeribacter indicus]